MQKARVLGHALHPMLVVFPLGLLATSLVWDICYLATGNTMWAVISFWTIVAGLVGGLIAAVPGFVDWMGIPNDTRAKRVGVTHLALNLVVIVLFVLSVALRLDEGYAEPEMAAMVLGWIGIGVAGVSGWMGGELVQRLGVGVDSHADLNAPSSLRVGKPLRPTEPRPV